MLKGRTGFSLFSVNWDVQSYVNRWSNYWWLSYEKKAAALGQRICCNAFLKMQNLWNLYFLDIYLVNFFKCSARTKEIGKCEHAGKEGKQSIEKTFKTKIKYCLMFNRKCVGSWVFLYIVCWCILQHCRWTMGMSLKLCRQRPAEQHAYAFLSFLSWIEKCNSCWTHRLYCTGLDLLLISVGVLERKHRVKPT